MGKSHKKTQVIPFKLEGQFVKFLGKAGKKPKLLWVNTEAGERYIKLAKPLRESLPEVIKPGDQLEVSGKQKYKPKTGELKLKAKRVTLKTPTASQQYEKLLQPSPQKTQASVMVCKKSSCRKRGAAKVHQAMNDTLRDRNLDDQVAIKDTGCMKQCKKGPCMVVMPDKARYNNVAPEDVPTLVDKHFGSKLEPEANVCQRSTVRCGGSTTQRRLSGTAWA